MKLYLKPSTPQHPKIPTPKTLNPMWILPTLTARWKRVLKKNLVTLNPKGPIPLNPEAINQILRPLKHCNTTIAQKATQHLTPKNMSEPSCIPKTKITYP